VDLGGGGLGSKIDFEVGSGNLRLCAERCFWREIVFGG